MSTIQLTSFQGARAIALSVQTVRIDELVDITEHIPGEAVAAWIHHGQGMVAVGETVRIRTAGPRRFTEAGAIFNELARRAKIDDEILLQQSGLVAFGSFSYADTSPRPSTLVIPKAILGSVNGEAFLTRIRLTGNHGPTEPEDWRALFRNSPNGTANPIQLEPDHTPDEYQRLVAQAVEYIRAGDVDKVVLSESSTGTSLTPLEPARLLRKLAARYPSTWVYHVDDILGASPEMLAQTNDGRVFSRVLAGSRPVTQIGEPNDTPRDTFRADAKTREEHAYAIDSVTERLTDISDNLTASTEPFVLRLPGIEHLASDVTARLRKTLTSLDVAARLHPSAAIGGTPRAEANRIIAELEPRDRGGYASPVGWMNAAGDGQWAIALRMAHLVDDYTIRLQAGAGLVAASDPATEHAEVLAKYHPMLSALHAS